MNLDTRLLQSLRCPFCGSGLEVSKVIGADPREGIEAGILTCGACRFEFPVVEGIPILMAPHDAVDFMGETTATVAVQGPRVSEITEALHQNDATAAFSMLFNPSRLTGEWFPPLGVASENSRTTADIVSMLPGRLGRVAARLRDRNRRRLAKTALPRARTRIATYLKTHEASLSALDVVDLYYRRYSGTEITHYFAYRFGQPRHLVALSLASLFGDGPEPVVDLACGLGHVAHFLSVSKPNRVVMGFDRDFVRLWIASRFVAPGAYFVCGQADRPFPFANGGVGDLYCSDAFHYFLNRAQAVREMRRVVAPQGTIALGCFGNAIEPREGYELTASGYSNLFAGMPHVIAGEEAILDAYLERRGPDLGAQAPFESLGNQKWLSLVASDRPGALRRGDSFREWPHAAGRLRINPIYDIVERRSNGDLLLRFRFPSDWYKFENEHYLRYAPEEYLLPARLAEAVERGERSVDLDQLIAKTIVIGLPERYLSASRPE